MENRKEKQTGAALTLDQLEIGQDAVIQEVGGDAGSLRQHLLDMGLTPGTEVTMVKRAPMGDPVELRVRSYDLTLRVAEAQDIVITNVHQAHARKEGASRVRVAPHPGKGEMGIFHTRSEGQALLEGVPLTFALAGN